MRSIAFSPDAHFVLTGGFDNTARLWRLEPTENTLLVDVYILLLKLKTNPYSLKDDQDAIDRLRVVGTQPEHDPQIIKIIEAFLYWATLPEQDCFICTENYNPSMNICMQLPCCKKLLCKACLDKLGTMTYSTNFEGYRFQHAVQAKCPFCNRPAAQMGTVKKLDPSIKGNSHD